ncbi:hypothetical protein CVT24_009917 [Panaeolus cyanescens]|uniref:Uncharacterized protein n=1 Tax=Panaeolus cyanescens TaxID=181874 RepID=A0A409WU78_9AGAR|nr:hypothetical protein CVT24_009917 [Panaeolus cyanescens]
MSLKGYTSPLSELQDFTLQPIPVASDVVLNELLPLIAVDTPLEENDKEELEQVIRKVAKAVSYSWFMAKHFAKGLNSLCSWLDSWNLGTIPLRSFGNYFIRATMGLRYAKANMIDAKVLYEEAESVVEPLFRKYLQKFGPDTIVKVTSKQSIGGELNFQKVPLKTISDSVLLRLREIIINSGYCLEMLQEVDEVLVSFLEDEAVSERQPLDTIPTWRKYPPQVWGVLYGAVEGISSDLESLMDDYAQLFDWIPQAGSAMEEMNRIATDIRYRETQVVSPVICKWRIPEDPDTPLDVLVQAVGKLGSCIIKVSNVIKIADNVSRLTISLEFTGSSQDALDRVTLRCLKSELHTSYPVRFLGLGSSGLDKRPTGPKKWLGLNRPPRVFTKFTETTAEWKDFTIKPIPVASDIVLNELVPLTAADTPLEKDATEELEQVIRKVAKAVSHSWMMAKQFARGLYFLCSRLNNWDLGRISLRRLADRFIGLTMDLRYAKANMIDAKGLYRGHPPGESVT